MNKKILVTLILISIYGILTGLFFKFYNESTVCHSHHSSCIRFCSEDTDNFSNEFLIQEFRKSKSGRNLDKDLTIYRGAPTCGLSFTPPNYNETRPYYFTPVCISAFRSYNFTIIITECI